DLWRRRRNSDRQGHLRLERAVHEGFCAKFREHECGVGLDRSAVHVRLEPSLGPDVWTRAGIAGDRRRSDTKPEKGINIEARWIPLVRNTQSPGASAGRRLIDATVDHRICGSWRSTFIFDRSRIRYTQLVHDLG